MSVIQSVEIDQSAPDVVPRMPAVGPDVVPRMPAVGRRGRRRVIVRNVRATPAEPAALRPPAPPPDSAEPSKPKRRGRQQVPKAEQTQRWALCSQLLAAGIERKRIAFELVKEFPAMSEANVATLIAAVLKDWAEEELDRRPHHRNAQIKRLHGHIAKARTAGSWSSVAQLERLMAQILGTLEPIEIRVRADVQLRQAVELAIDAMPAARVRALADKAREHRALLEGGNGRKVLEAAVEVSSAP